MKRRFAAQSKSSNFVEVCFVPTLDTMVDVYKETIGFSFIPSPLAGEGRDGGAVQLAPSPRSSPVEGEEVERRPVDNYRVSWLVSLTPLATEHLFRAEDG